MPAKIVVKPYRGGSRVSLLGSSGKELLTSSVFKEPRAKGATLRALKGLLGEDVVVEDHTVASKKVASTKAVAAQKTAEVVVASTKSLVDKVEEKLGAKPVARRSTRPRKASASSS